MSRQRPLTPIEQARHCPLCGAVPGERCTNPSGGYYATGVHSARAKATATASLPARAEHKTRLQQLTAYFWLLLGHAEKIEDRERRNDLFDRIERTIAAVEAEKKRPVPCGLGWPSGVHALEDVPRAGADVMDRVLEGLRQR